MKKELTIVPLPKAEWKGTPIMMRYTTEEYDFPDSLYQDHWEKAEAYGMYTEENGERKMLACIEVCPEEWSNRLMVTELWVDDSLHRQGVGTALMNKAKEVAKAQGRRAIILETQSCNVRAIAFYRSQGFQLLGFDTCCYRNTDIKRHEVRINLVYFMDDRDGRW